MISVPSFQVNLRLHTLVLVSQGHHRGNYSMSTNNNTAGSKLKKTMGLTSVVMFGAGTAIGVSIFSVLQPAAAQAGSGLLIAIFLAAIPMLFFALCYSFMASADPRTGASYEWPRRYLHPGVGFLVVWLRIITNIGAITVLGLVLVSYLGTVLPLPVKPTMAALFTLIFGLNLFGVKAAARVQIIMMSVLVITLGIFVASGTVVGTTEQIGPVFGAHWLAILGAVPLLISLFLGIETSVEMADEVKDAERTIPKGIALAILLTAGVYFSISYVALSLIGPEGLAQSDAPLFDAAQAAMGDWALLVILCAAVTAIVTTINALAVVFSRTLFALGKSKALPAILERIHPRYRTPHVAIITAYLLVMCGLFLPPSLTFLLLAVNIPTMLKYLACSASTMQVIRKFPTISQQSRWTLSRNKIFYAAIGGCVLAVAVILLGLTADWRPYILIISWATIGVILWFAYVRKHVDRLELETPVAEKEE